MWSMWLGWEGEEGGGVGEEGGGEGGEGRARGVVERGKR